MITITIDYNSDEVILQTKTETHTFDKPKNMKQLENLIYELINSVFEEKHISLGKIDEDTRTTIDEW